jgi:hypothetical protein
MTFSDLRCSPTCGECARRRCRFCARGSSRVFTVIIDATGSFPRHDMPASRRARTPDRVFPRSHGGDGDDLGGAAECTDRHSFRVVCSRPRCGGCVRPRHHRATRYRGVGQAFVDSLRSQVGPVTRCSPQRTFPMCSPGSPVSRGFRRESRLGGRRETTYPPGCVSPGLPRSAASGQRM